MENYTKSTIPYERLSNLSINELPEEETRLIEQI